MAEDRKKTNVVVACGRPVSLSQLLKDSEGLAQGKLIDIDAHAAKGFGPHHSAAYGYTEQAIWGKNRPTKRERS